MKPRRSYLKLAFGAGWVFSLVLVLSACSTTRSAGRSVSPTVSPAEVLLTATPPRRELPEGWHQVLPYDGIRPIYNPEFTPGENADLAEDELVMGVSWEGRAKAFPVTVLRIREMVNDEMAGVPYLVSW